MGRKAKARPDKSRFVAYYRVSTKMQGKSGLGLEAQEKAVTDYLGQNGKELIASFTEIESGRMNQRPELLKALALCRERGATLIVAKIDRLSRDASYLLGLLRDAQVDFYFCDLPSADKFTIGILALVAEREADLISERTKAGLAMAKRRGTKLGNPNASKAAKLAHKAHKQKTAMFDKRTLPVIQQIQKAGIQTLQGVADALNARAVPTSRGGRWFPGTVRSLLLRAA